MLGVILTMILRGDLLIIDPRRFLAQDSVNHFLYLIIIGINLNK